MLGWSDDDNLTHCCALICVKVPAFSSLYQNSEIKGRLLIKHIAIGRAEVKTDARQK